jgi:hypothetical protein
MMAERAPSTIHMRRYWSPRLLMRSSTVRPAVEYCRGVSPSHALRWRPVLNALPSPIAATRAVAVIGPTPSIFPHRWHRSSGAIDALDQFVVPEAALFQQPEALSHLTEQLTKEGIEFGLLEQFGQGAAQRRKALWLR